MNIASIKIQEAQRDNSNRNKNSMETNGDEFSLVLSKEMKSKIKGKADTNLKENLEQDHKDNSELLSNILNLSYLGKIQESTVELDTELVATSELDLAVGHIGMNDQSLEAMEFTEENFKIIDSKEVISSLAMEDVEVEDLLAKDNLEIKPHMTDKAKDKKDISILDREDFHDKNPKVESLRNEEPMDKEISQEIQAKEKPTIKQDKDINFMDNLQPKNQSNVKVEANITVEAVEDFSQNIEKINDSIIQLIETDTEGGVDVVKVKLYPEELGTVDVTLKMEEGKLIAKILVENDFVKGLFNSRINELNESLVKQNIVLEKINIDLNHNPNPNSNSEQAFNLNGDGSFNQDKGHQSNSRRNLGLYNRESINPSITERNIHDSSAISILA